MLQVKDVRKEYRTGEQVQVALNGVSLNLRENEFVAILGPSGSGKTTLLNVIGGLDQYDSGDLIIDGISTKKYTDRDWDSYRNHTIGFVFQSYNLIPHQTVLANVELALNISGVPRNQRRKRAVAALEAVGLGNQLHKKPNQMSGGQMQRVAIARALVNNPSVLLADEPTGALDSETSIQIMDLLKEVSRDRLVVMVTHNPELAQEYANRIVRVKDGSIVGDTNPYEVDEALTEPPRHKNMGKSSMSFLSALSLSFNNLKSKLGRTLLTSFAGSIGIIGIALILSLAAGFQFYIDGIQENTLANYPLTIQAESANMTSALAGMAMSGGGESQEEPGTVREQPALAQMFGVIGSNDLAAFKTHLEEHYDEIGHTLNAVQYSYGIKPRIYGPDPRHVQQMNPATLFDKILGSNTMASYMNMDSFQEMLGNQELLDTQYQVLEGRWPQAYNELVFVLPGSQRIPDHVAYTVGLKDMEVLDTMINRVLNGEEPGPMGEPMTWTYEDLMALNFRLVSVPDLYRYNEEYKVWEDMSQDSDYMAQIIEEGEPLRVVGIISPRESGGGASMAPGLAYLPSLTQHVIDEARASRLVQDQLADPEHDVFSGVAFGSGEKNQGLRFEDMITVDEDAISSAFGMDVDPAVVVSLLESYLNGAMGSIDVDTAGAQKDFTQTLQELSRKMLEDYVALAADEEGNALLTLAQAEPLVEDFLQTDFAAEKMQTLAARYGLPADTFPQIYRPLMVGLVSGYITQNGTLELPPLLPPETEVPDSSQPSSQEDTGAEPTEEPTEHLQPPAETSQLPPLPTGEDPIPAPTVPRDPTAPSVSNLAFEAPEELPSIPGLPDLELKPEAVQLTFRSEEIAEMVRVFAENPVTQGSASVVSMKMMEPFVFDQILSKMAGFGDVLMGYFGSSFHVDEEALTNAFQFNMEEDELRRLMAAMSNQGQERNADTNLQTLGYADLASPSAMSIYMVDFAGKEEFMDFLDAYNDSMTQAGREEQVIHYADMTGMMMSSVRTIIDAVSYVLIAFVAVSLVVSSIMIGIITYISVMERTKEIGVLRAMGASKHNISQVFNAETFIIGLCSGVIGIGVTLLLLIPGNMLIHHLTGIPSISAQLPPVSAFILILISMGLTLLGGLIPSRQAAKKDPVIALRTE